jgi:hypothetical protein
VGHDRAAGTLDGNRSSDLCRYEAMLRDAAEEVPGTLSEGVRKAEEKDSVVYCAGQGGAFRCPPRTS